MGLIAVARQALNDASTRTSNVSDMLEAVLIHCPYCGEAIEILVDGSASSQRYFEDCQVCCRPIDVSVSIDEDGEPQVSVGSEDDA
ncbi:Cysteine-rich CPXCG protein [Dyella terrae]|nr:Cysteine-rich CPXCG protein [Dyella terrae]